MKEQKRPWAHAFEAYKTLEHTRDHRGHVQPAVFKGGVTSGCVGLGDDLQRDGVIHLNGRCFRAHDNEDDMWLSCVCADGGRVQALVPHFFVDGSHRADVVIANDSCRGQ